MKYSMHEQHIVHCVLCKKAESNPQIPNQQTLSSLEIEILEVCKSKKKYYVLIFDPKMFIPFVNGVELPKF